MFTFKLSSGFFGLVGGSVIAFSFRQPASASTDALHPSKYNWDHTKPWEAFDHASIRRGFLVYRQICATCHSLNSIAYRHLINVSHTENELKEIAAEIEVTDGPNGEGEMFQRPGKITDKLPRPYPNNEAARYANNGALPPDLSLMIKARKGGENYVFSLLTGYTSPPHGINLRSGLYYNPYFSGGAIGMAPPLTADGLVEYDDGTVPTISQMAKDVTTFLCWAAEPEHDERHKLGLKSLLVLTLLFIPTFYLKKFKWNVLKHRVVTFGKRP